MNRNKTNSISDQLISDYIKTKNINDLQKIYNFKNALDVKFMQYYLEDFDNLVSPYEPNIILRNLKYQSQVCAKIYLSKAYLDMYNISIDKALKILEAFLNCPYLKPNFYIKIPTRYLSIRGQIGLKKINALFNLYEVLGFIITKKDREGTYAKVTPLVLNDPWLKEKFYYNEYQNNKAYMIAKDIKENLYHYNIDQNTKNKNIRRSIIEITLAFNHIIETDPVLHNQYYINGIRTDIVYAICPVKFIAFMLGISEKKVRKELNKLCNKTNFISKHDKMYIDSFGKKHYTNYEYKYFNKEIITKDTKFEDGHPIIDEDSIIWHEINLENCKYYKSFKANKDNIIMTVNNALTIYALRDLINLVDEKEDEIITPELQKLNQEELAKGEGTYFKGFGSVYNNIEILKKYEHKKFKPYMPTKLKLDDMNVPRLIQALKKTMFSLNNCGREAYNRLLKQKNYIEEIIKEKVFIYSKEINYKQAKKWKEEIEYLTSNQNPNEQVLYEYIEIPLYVTQGEQILERLASIRI